MGSGEFGPNLDSQNEKNLFGWLSLSPQPDLMIINQMKNHFCTGWEDLIETDRITVICLTSGYHIMFIKPYMSLPMLCIGYWSVTQQIAAVVCVWNINRLLLNKYNNVHFFLLKLLFWDCLLTFVLHLLLSCPATASYKDSEFHKSVWWQGLLWFQWRASPSIWHH